MYCFCLLIVCFAKLRYFVDWTGIVDYNFKSVTGMYFAALGALILK